MRDFPLHLPKTNRSLDDLQADGRMTEKDWKLLDDAVQHAILKAGASILRTKRTKAPA